MTKNERRAYGLFNCRVASAINSLKRYADDYDCSGLKEIIEGLEEALNDAKRVIK